jgi:hypothetical protein
MYFYPPSTGEWAISSTYSGNSYSTSATVTSLSVQAPAILKIKPDGSTVLPTDDIQTWLNCADIYDKTSYTTLSDILNDSTTLSALIADNNAVDYLVRSTTWASGTCADSTAMSYIGLNNYASNKLTDNIDWLTAIVNSEYIDSVLNVKVPRMTSNNAPSGNCFASSYYGANYEPFRAFRNNFDGTGGSGNCWQSSNGSTTNQRIGYEFTSAQKIKAVAIGNTNYPTSSINTFRVEVEDNGSWTPLTDTLTNDTSVTTKNVFIVSNENSYAKWSIYALTNGGGTAVVSANTIQFYGRVDV